MPTIYITKFALTAGITEHQVSPENVRGDCAYPGAPFASFVSFKMGVHAHLTREAAVAAANKERDKKIESIRKQIKRLEALTFQ